MVHADELNACRSSVLMGNSAFDLTVELADHNGTARGLARACVVSKRARVVVFERAFCVTQGHTRTRACTYTHTVELNYDLSNSG